MAPSDRPPEGTGPAPSGSIGAMDAAGPARTLVAGAANTKDTARGAAPPAATTEKTTGPTANSELGVYRLVELLGEGGMGSVWKAVHTKLKKTVALKVLPQQLTRDPETVARFEREMEAVGALDHPNIVRAMDAGEVDGTHYLVMEYVEGLDLGKLVQTKGKRPVKEACEMVRQAAVGLAHAHQHGLVHRDVKPGNLLLSKQGKVKILDLGLARLQGDAASPQASKQLTGFGLILGTPDYMSPEQWDDTHAVDHRADLYALGCTLFFLLTGRAPYEDAAHQSLAKKLAGHSAEPPPDLKKERPEVSEELDTLYRRLMAKDPKQRYSTAADVARTLMAIVKGQTPPAASITASAAAASTTRGPAAVPPTGNSLVAGAPDAGLDSVLAAIAVDTLPTRSAVRQKPPVKAAKRSGAPPKIPMLWIAAGGLAVVVLLAGIIIKIATGDGKGTEITAPEGSKIEITSGDGQAKSQPEPIADPPAARPESQPTHQPGPTLTKGSKAGDEWDANGLKMNFCWCPAGDFTMGSSADEPGRSLIESQVQVTLPGFWLAKFEVTQAEWKDVMDSTLEDQRKKAARPALKESGPRHPMYFVNHDEATEFCRRLTQRERAAGRLPPGWDYRLPNEAQWEYACRAGTKTRFASGDDEAVVEQYAWSAATSAGTTHEVGTKKANAWGLCDMHGNVWEWCRDWYATTLPGGRAPEVSEGGPLRIDRGGSWEVQPKFLRSAFRDGSAPANRSHSVGFRVAIVSPDVTTPPFAIAPFDAAQAKARQEAWAKLLGVPVERTNSIGMKFVLIPPGEYSRGTADSDVERVVREQYGNAPRDHFDDEKPQHRVRITRPFYLGRYEVTVAEFRSFTEAAGFKTDAENGRKNWGYDAATGEISERAEYSWKNPGFAQTDRHPVPNVSWNDSVAFNAWLSRKEGQTYRLPTEGEWEHACRAGTISIFSCGDTYASLKGFANLSDPSLKNMKGAPVFHFYAPFDDGFAFTAPVGSFQPNAFGLHDMHGNLWEWCRDAYDPSDYANHAGQMVVDPAGPPGSRRNARGGSWLDGPIHQRSAERNLTSNLDQGANTCGFRVLLEVPSKEDELTAEAGNSK